MFGLDEIWTEGGQATDENTIVLSLNCENRLAEDRPVTST
jgi:hypothetical protein